MSRARAHSWAVLRSQVSHLAPVATVTSTRRERGATSTSNTTVSPHKTPHPHAVSAYSHHPTEKTATAANPATPVKKKGYVQEVSTPHVENARKQLAKIDFHIALPRRTPQTAANNKRRAAAVVDISEGGPENTAAEQQTTAKKGRRHNKAAAENTPARAANPLGIEFASSGYTQRAYSPTPERMPAPYPQVYTGASTAGPWGTQPAVPVFAPAPATPAATAAAIQNMPTTMNIAFPGRFTAAEARRTARMLRNMAQGLEDTADELEELKGVGYRHGV